MKGCFMNNQFVNGVYKGFTWSDDAPQVVCEMDVILDDLLLTLRIATGTRILMPVSVRRSEIRDLRREEIAAHYNEGADIEGIVGIELGEGGIHLLLLREPTDEEVNADLEPGEEPILASDVNRILVLGLPGEEAFGHSMLFTPEQVHAGTFDRAVALTEQQLGKGTIPRIANNGKPA
jgi:hypothetical protein